MPKNKTALNRRSKPGMDVTPLTRAVLPHFEAQPILTRTNRYEVSSTSGGCILTAVDFLNMFMYVNVSAVSGHLLIESFRLLSISIWSSPGGQTATTTSSQTVAIDWAGAQRRVADSSIGGAYPAYVHSSPPKGTLSSFWFRQGDTTAVCSLSVNVSDIIDVRYQYVINDGSPAVMPLASPVPSSAAADAIYMRALNNQTALDRILPVSYPATGA